jgi:3-deoxy-manno-octulosonate cytidylyltransferase (CMP-KDO synthetase)
MTEPRAIAIVPARHASTRFPGKPLAADTGKPMIVHVLERVAACRTVGRIIVATDDDRIRRAVEAAGFEARMTRADHPNGTSRVAEVARTVDDDLVVNVQGDEPQIEPELVDRTVRALAARPDVPMATLVSPFAPGEDPANPNIVKCVVGVDGRAFLETFVALAPTPLERTESLEQLRALEHGHAILCAEGEAHFTGIDTPEQYAAFVARMRG